jgi:hypothetical protein
MGNFGIPNEWEITEAMIVFGGSFVQTLGRLIRQADMDNKRRLVSAFPEYIEQYKELARMLPEKK